MLAGSVFRMGVNGRPELVAVVPECPSGLGFLPDGRLLVASMRDRRVLRLDPDGNLVCHADLSDLVSHDINDMVVDEWGYAYVGAFGFERCAATAFKMAALVLVRPTGEAEIVARDLAFPNGSAVLSSPRRRLIVAETFGHKLTVFDIADNGTLHDRKLFADLDDISPDGICHDQDGGVWVAASNTARFVRVLEGGEITGEVRVEGRHAVSCTLGGPEARHLFCLTTDAGFEYNVPNENCTSRVDVFPVTVPGWACPDPAGA